MSNMFCKTDSIDMIQEIGLNHKTSPSSNMELMSGSCYCPQKLFVIAGFDYRINSNWWSSGYASSWENMELVGDTAVTSVETVSTRSAVYPHITYSLQKAGSATFDVASYETVNPSGKILDSGPTSGISTTAVWPSYGQVIQQNVLYNLPAKSVITYDTALTAIS